MDTKTLVVGQEVWLASGYLTAKGKVVHIGPRYVEVEICGHPDGLGDAQILRFDIGGLGREEEGTYECGIWRVYDKPFV